MKTNYSTNEFLILNNKLKLKTDKLKLFLLIYL